MAEPPNRTQPRISRFWPFPRVYYGWAVLLAAVLSSFATVATQGPIMGVFFRPIQEEMGWSALTLTTGFVIGTIAGSLASPWVGRRLDRRGGRVVIVTAGSVIALSMVGLSLMTEPWHFWLFFGAARGAAVGGVALGTMVGLASWHVRRRGRVIGMIGTGQRAGQALLPLPILAIMLAFSWREAWLALAAVVVLLLVVPSGLLVRRRPEDYGLLPDGDLPGELAEGEGLGDSVEETWTLAEAKRTRTLWALMVAQASVVLSVNAVNLHITANFQDHMAVELAVTAVAIFATAAALSTLPWGFVLERIHVRYVGLTAVGLLFTAMLIAVRADTFAGAVFFAVTYGLGLGAWTVTSRLLFASYFGRRSFGSIRGFAAPIMVAVNPAGPLFAAYVRDTSDSYAAAFVVFAVVLAVAFAAFLVAVPVRKRADERPSGGSPV
ncbi:MAG: MFS transporter [Planctomycetes bacterium]|nr:MFS transporter [Planctomycetota bacterium]